MNRCASATKKDEKALPSMKIIKLVCEPVESQVSIASLLQSAGQPTVLNQTKRPIFKRTPSRPRRRRGTREEVCLKEIRTSPSPMSEMREQHDKGRIGHLTDHEGVAWNIEAVDG